MKVDINKKTNMPDVAILDEHDLVEAALIQEMMQSKGYQVLIKYLTFSREAMIERGKSGIRTEATRKLSDVKWGVISGWDECMAIPQRIVDRARKFIDEQEDAKNAGNGDGQFNEQ